MLRLMCLLLMTSFSKGLVYNVPNSGWTSSKWNWGYGMGTGHECAAICRSTYQTRSQREKLVKGLLENSGEPTNFEEVKLVLALTWQKGQWTGRDGGPEGYGQVLELMARAKRYEEGSEQDCAKNLVSDMAERFHLLEPEAALQERMDALWQDAEDFDAARRICSGLVLESMGFVETGC